MRESGFAAFVDEEGKSVPSDASCQERGERSRRTVRREGELMRCERKGKGGRSGLKSVSGGTRSCQTGGGLTREAG